MKENYEKPVLDIIYFQVEDVIRTSIGSEDPDDNTRDFDSLFK